MAPAVRPSRPDRAEGLGRPEIHWLCYALLVVGFIAAWAAGRVGRSPLAETDARGRDRPPVLHRVNANRAAWYELAELPGLGKTLAKRIVAYRGKNGPFICVEELLNVKGIGPSTLADIEREVFCGPQPGNQERGFE